jgi:hypothetical protein
MYTDAGHVGPAYATNSWHHEKYIACCCEERAGPQRRPSRNLPCAQNFSQHPLSPSSFPCKRAALQLQRGRVHHWYHQQQLFSAPRAPFPLPSMNMRIPACSRSPHSLHLDTVLLAQATTCHGPARSCRRSAQLEHPPVDWSQQRHGRRSVSAPGSSSHVYPLLSAKHPALVAWSS